MNHKERFLEALQRIDSDVLDSEYRAALYILTCDDSLWHKASDYIERHSIDIATMLQKVDLSSGYRTLVQLAGNLFNGQTTVDLNEVCCVLDERNFQVALMALQLRRGNVDIDTIAFKE